MIESINNNMNLIINKNNGMVFCEDCYNLFHNKYGRGDNSLWQMLAFIK
jgi:hypothetical protein